MKNTLKELVNSMKPGDARKVQHQGWTIDVECVSDEDWMMSASQPSRMVATRGSDINRIIKLIVEAIEK